MNDKVVCIRFSNFCSSNAYSAKCWLKQFLTCALLCLSILACHYFSAQAKGATIWIDFSAQIGFSGGTNWNTGVIETGVSSAPGLIDSLGNATGIGIAPMTNLVTSGSSNGTAGTGWPSWVVATAVRDWLAGTAGQTGTMTFTGLDQNTLYSFQLVAARETAGSGTDRLATYTIGSTSYVNANANTLYTNRSVLTFNNVAPVSDGLGGYKIDFTVAVPTGSFAYINAMQITTSPVPEPGSIALAGLGLIGIGWAAYRRYLQQTHIKI